MPFNPADAARYPALIGCDEVGRGPLCGPVVVAAVWFDPVKLPPDLLGALDDSKKLAAPLRERLSRELLDHAKVALAASSAAAIDSRGGIRVTTLDAMRRAVLRLGIRAPLRFDGLDVPPGLEGFAAEAVVKGDSKVPQIAAASIIAKTCRDALMERLARRYPGYGWETNAGYGTALHMSALIQLGPTPHHRRSFAPVARAIAHANGEVSPGGRGNGF